ncbi:MAG: DEAD/DEAH box helicase [Ahniella sp.]|nr:DEAD/DEAH box helicase [Ahniella sp.]
MNATASLYHPVFLVQTPEMIDESQEALIVRRIFEMFVDVDWESAFKRSVVRKGQSLEFDTTFMSAQQMQPDLMVASFEVPVSKSSRRQNAVHILVPRDLSRWAAQCACDRTGRCEHVVAALSALCLGEGLTEEDYEELFLADEQAEESIDTGTLTAPPPDVVIAENEREWEAWQVAELSRAKASATVARVANKPPEQLVYVFHMSSPGITLDFEMALLDSSTGKSPRLNGRRILPIQFGRVDRRVTRKFGIGSADEAMLWRIANQVPDFDYPHILQLSGSEGDAIVSELLDHHTCVLVQPGRPRLRKGQARPYQYQWIRGPREMSELHGGVDGASVIAPVGALWYLDTGTMEIGPVGGITSEQFHALQRLPKVHASNERKVAALLAMVPSATHVPPPVAVTIQQQAGEPKARLLLLREASPTKPEKAQWIGALRFCYGNTEVPDDGQARTLIQDEHANLATVVIRDSDRELAFRQSMQRVGCVPMESGATSLAMKPLKAGMKWRGDQNHASTLKESAERWLMLVGALEGRGISVDIPADFGVDIRTVENDELSANLDHSSRPGWFDVELGVDIDGRRVSLLPILARAIQRQELNLTAFLHESPEARMVIRTDHGTHLSLRLDELRRYCAPLIEWLTDLNGREVSLPMARADVLSELLDANANVKGPETLTRVAKAIRGEWTRSMAPDPEGLAATLRPYQSAGIEWLDFLAEHQLGGLLADDMGLGKTIQVLAHVLSERHKSRLRNESTKPALVVMPTSLVPNWQMEAARFAPSLRVLVLHGGSRHGQFDRISETDLVLTTYALLVRDIEILTKFDFSLAVFDEAQALKNPLTQSALCARKIRADRRIAMTGTPIENHLGELWSQFDLILPGLLGAQKHFAARFRTPIEKHGADAIRDRLNARIRPFILRRTKQEVAAELPPKTLITKRIALDGRQRDLYETLRLAMHDLVRQAISNKGLSASRIVVLDALLKLRQACCDPKLVKLPEARKVTTSAKRECLRDMVRELLDEGRRILVFRSSPRCWT